MGSVSIHPNRIDFWPFRLASTSRRALCAPLIFFAYQERWLYWCAQWCQGIHCWPMITVHVSTSVWWYRIRSKCRKKAKSKFLLINYSPSTLVVVLKLSLSMLVTREFISQIHSSSSGSISVSLLESGFSEVVSHQPQENPNRGGNQ